MKRVPIIAVLLLAACGAQDAPAPQRPRTQAGPSLQASSAVVTFLGNRENYTITKTPAGFDVTDTVGNGGTVAVGGTAVLEFIDTNVALDTEGRAGQAYRIYQAAFNRKPDAAGLGYWIAVMANGASLAAVAASFTTSAEFQQMYGAHPDNRTLLVRLYQNVLHREPDKAGLDYWLSVLDNKLATLPEVLVSFSESPENIQTVAAAIAAGVAYPADARSAAMAALRSPSDAFSGTSIDSCRWFDWSSSAPMASQNNGLLLQTNGEQDVSVPRVLSQYSVRDDFSIEINVAVDTGFDPAIPGQAQKYAAFGLYVDQNNYLMLSFAKEGDRNVIKPLRNENGRFENPPTFPINASSARLRLSSTGGTISLAYDAGTGWMSAGSLARVGDGEYYVSLTAASIGVRQKFGATFKDFVFSSGTSSYRPYVRGPLSARADFAAGGVSEGYAYDKLLGDGGWGSINPFQVMADNGMGWLRTGVTTQSVAALKNTPVAAWTSLPWSNAYWQSQELTSEVLALSAGAGLQNALYFYLSDKAANASVQDAPPEWRGLSVAETALRVQQHTQDVTKLYKLQGRSISLYEIGNEIDTGILNFRPGDRIALPAGGASVEDLAYFRTQVWPTEAILLKAAIAGIRSVDPNARIVLHASYIGINPADMLAKAFFKAMVDNGVNFDIAGLSIPYSQGAWRLNEYSTDCWFQRLQETSDYVARLGKKTMISEASYPQSPTGSIAAPMSEFPYTDAGQAAWTREYLRFGNNNPNIVGFMYFYPDWYPGRARGDSATLVLESYGLFNANRSSRPALKEYKLPLRQ